MSYLRYLCYLRIVVSNIYCVVFCIVCLRPVCRVPNVASFSGLSIIAKNTNSTGTLHWSSTLVNIYSYKYLLA